MSPIILFALLVASMHCFLGPRLEVIITPIFFISLTYEGLLVYRVLIVWIFSTYNRYFAFVSVFIFCLGVCFPVPVDEVENQREKLCEYVLFS